MRNETRTYLAEMRKARKAIEARKPLLEANRAKLDAYRADAAAAVAAVRTAHGYDGLIEERNQMRADMKADAVTELNESIRVIVSSIRRLVYSTANDFRFARYALENRYRIRIYPGPTMDLSDFRHRFEGFANLACADGYLDERAVHIHKGYVYVTDKPSCVFQNDITLVFPVDLLDNAEKFVAEMDDLAKRLKAAKVGGYADIMPADEGTQKLLYYVLAKKFGPKAGRGSKTVTVGTDPDDDEEENA